jgi:hypothetical protein
MYSYPLSTHGLQVLKNTQIHYNILPVVLILDVPIATVSFHPSHVVGIFDSLIIFDMILCLPHFNSGRGQQHTDNELSSLPVAREQIVKREWYLCRQGRVLIMHF